MANPVFGHSMRDERRMVQVVRAWDPPPPNPFIGGRQPLAPRTNPPSLLSINSPPAYEWEVITLDPEDTTAYFRAQKWAAQKIIVSVDNPPPQDDERAAVSGLIIQSIWNPPPVPYPQQQKKSAAISVIAASGAMSSAGVGTDAWVGDSQANTAQKTSLQAHILRAWEVPATIQQRRNFVPQISATSATGDIASTGASTATWISSSSQPVTPKFVPQPHIIRSWDPPPPSPFLGGWEPLAPRKLAPKLLGEEAASGPPGYIWELVELDPEDTTAYFRAQPRYKAIAGPLPTTGALRSDGVGTATWVGTFTQPFVPKTPFQTHITRGWEVPATITIELPQVAISSGNGDISSVGSGTASFVGTSAQNTAPRKLIQMQIISAWAPQQLLLQPRRFLPQVAVAGAGALRSLGVGLATWVGTESASAVFFGAGTSTARFRGTSRGAQAENLDGWLPARIRAEKRRRKDEAEIAIIMSAVLPFLQRGTVSRPTHISVPRNVRTLQ